MIYKNKFINIQEIWFDEKREVYSYIDKVVYRQVSKQQENCEEFTTLLIDLVEDKEKIFQLFKKNNKYEINRAEKKDNLTFNIYSENIATDIVDNFLHANEKFSDERNRGNLTYKTIKKYLDVNCLVISTICDESGNNLVWHTYIISGKRARLFTSSSLFSEEDNERRNLIGRANRLLHWKDILYFKNNNFLTYDFGGWYMGKTDKKLLGINKFKESFGGHKELSYNYNRCTSMKCKLYELLSKIKSLLK